MVIKYILKNFGRRKVRTILMILSLCVSIGLIVTMSATVETIRRSNVDLIASAVGRYDMAISKRDIALDPFLSFPQLSQQVLAADDRVTAVYPRLESQVELNNNGDVFFATMLALDPDVDDIGFVEVVEGEYQLGGGNVALLQETAFTLGLEVGDTIDVSYSFPRIREEGEVLVPGASEQRASERFTVSSIVLQDGVTSSNVTSGFIMHIADAQVWLGLGDRVQRAIATVDPSLYETNNADLAALRVRDVVSQVQADLGEEFLFELDKAAVLSGAAQGFLAIQALINTYGLMSLGVVGLLVYTLVMTNVQEQKRDMAILRILGGQRNFLFTLIIAEVVVIGLIGITLGVGLGQLITAFIVVPLIEQQMATQGIMSTLTPELSVAAILPAVIASFTVLIISSLRPAQEAAKTKVMHAINPGVADNIQIEDIAALRERRPNFRLFLAGLALMLIFALIAGFQIVETFGGPALEVTFVLLALGLMVLGLGLMFFITTIPFERLVLWLMGLIVPRLTFFAERNIVRGKGRNTLISLLVLFSGVLPSFLATQVALENANFEANTRQNFGTDATLEAGGWWLSDEEAETFRLTPTFRTDELAFLPGVEQSVALTYEYGTSIGDTLNFRQAPVTIQGVDGRLDEVLYSDLVQFESQEGNALEKITTSREGIIISQGLADYLALGLGDTVRLQAQGTDNTLQLRVIGIASVLPGFSNIGSSRLTAQNGSHALVSYEIFRELITELNAPLPSLDARLVSQVMFSVEPETDVDEMAAEMSNRYVEDYTFFTRFMETRLELNRRSQASQQIFLLVLTAISFTTAVFGVFAVIFVTIYARRLEIGMLKAVGMKQRQLTGMLIVESITMTLGSALAGITAGAAMGYIQFYGQQALQEAPTIFAIDTLVSPFIVIMIVVASIIGAAFSARRIVKKRAVEILRM